MFYDKIRPFLQRRDLDRLEYLIDQFQSEKAYSLLEKLVLNPKTDFHKLACMLYINKINKSEIYSPYLDRLLETLNSVNGKSISDSEILPLVATPTKENDKNRISWQLNFNCFCSKNLVFGLTEIGPGVENSNDIFILSGLRFVRSVMSKQDNGNFKKTQLFKYKESESNKYAEFITICHETSKLSFYFINKDNKSVYLYK